MPLAFFIAIISALALGGATIIEKIILRKRKVDTKLYIVAGFSAIILSMLPFLYFFWRVDAPALEIKNIFIMLGVIIISVLANIFALKAVKWEKITNLEPAKLLEPLFVIILAVLFSFIFGQELFERNTKIVIPASIAGATLIFSHIKKHHLDFNKYFIAMILGSFFFALELVLSRLILNYYSPISFYFIRSFFIFLICLIIFRPKFDKLNSKVKWEILATGAIWVVYRILMYYGYLKIGVIFTTLMLMIGPIFIYFLAWKLLKEKLSWRNIVAIVIIIGSILYATLG